jgi:hypothetical protein
MALCWKYKKDVVLLHTVHNQEMTDVKGDPRKKKYQVITDYNTKGGVDLVASTHQFTLYLENKEIVSTGRYSFTFRN